MSGRAETSSSSTQKWLPYLGLALAVFAAYGNVYDNVLLFDDNLILTANEYLRGWGTFRLLLTSSTTAGAHIAGGFYRPMQLALYFLIYQLNGLEPFGFHLLNVSLHAMNACLVFLLGRRLGFNPWPVFFAALIWAMHPLHTEVITYASATAEPLFTFFCLLGTLVLVPDFTARRFWAAIPLFLLGLLSKESAVVFPALVISCIFLLDKNRLHPKTYLRTWPLWIVAGLYTWWRMTAPGFDGPQTYGDFYALHGYDNLKLYADNFPYRAYTFFATLPAYLKLIIWPAGLHMERSFPVYVSLWPVETWEGIAMIAAAAGQIIWGRGKRGLPLSFALLWFAAAHFPNTGLLLPMNSQFLEHWMYLPCIGLFLGVAETISSALNTTPWSKVKPAAAVAALIVAAILGLRTFEQNMVWQNPFTFYANIFKYGEISPRAHNNLALAYMGEGNYPAAIAEFQKAIDLTDTYAETRYNLALALLSSPDPDAAIPAAIENLNRALEIDPHFYRAWESLASIYDHIGDSGKAAMCRKKAEENYGGNIAK